jgi:hypothetical protein
MLDLNSDTLIQSKQSRFVIFRNNVIGFWDFYHGVGSPKAHTPTPPPFLTEAFWWPFFNQEILNLGSEIQI